MYRGIAGYSHTAVVRASKQRRRNLIQANVVLSTPNESVSYGQPMRYVSYSRMARQFACATHHARGTCYRATCKN